MTLKDRIKSQAIEDMVVEASADIKALNRAVARLAEAVRNVEAKLLDIRKNKSC